MNAVGTQEAECVRAPVLIMAGGSGGHVFPALAVAEELLARGRDLVWLGTRGGAEQEWLKGRGFPLEFVQAAGVRGGGLRRLLKGILCCALGLLQACKVMRRHRPAMALGMGGYASVPGGVAAWLLGIPLCIHEQNAVSGYANRLLSKFAVRRLQGFPDSLVGAQTTGNPVRAGLCDGVRAAPQETDLRVLVLGGSQGADTLNRLMPEALAGWQPGGLDVLHQCGKGRTAHYAGVQARVRVVEFIEDMAAAYRWAHLAVCRAGAITIAELCATGLPAVLVPYPHAGSHQEQNARMLCAQGGAILLREAELTAARLGAVLQELAGDRGRLVGMGKCSRRLARPDAATRIADICIALSGGAEVTP